MCTPLVMQPGMDAALDSERMAAARDNAFTQIAQAVDERREMLPYDEMLASKAIIPSGETIMSKTAFEIGSGSGRRPPAPFGFPERFVLVPRLMVLCVALLAAALLSHPVSAGGLEVRTLTGEASSLGEQITRGQWTLVMVWTTYCGVCREQYPTISEFHTRHHENKATVLGIALDGYGEAEKVADYRSAQGHTFPSVLAESDTFAYGFERATGEAFTGTPTYLFFDGDGKLRAYLSGPVSNAALERAIQ